MSERIEIYDGKYTVVNNLSSGGGLHALRYGEEWRNLAGDNLVLAMYHEIVELQDKVTQLQATNTEIVETVFGDAIRKSAEVLAEEIRKKLGGE